MKIWLASIVILAIGSGALYWVFAGNSDANGKAGWAPPPPVVEAGPVQLGRVDRRVNAVGTLRSNESITVRPEIAGRVDTIRFAEGEPVVAGAVLITLEDSIYRAEVAEKAANRRLAEINFKRADEMLRKGASSADGRDRAMAQLEAETAALDLARARLAKATMYAPFAGIVGLRRVSVGDFVSAGDDLVELVELHPLKVDFRVGEIFLPAVRVGQRLDIQVDAFPAETFRGEVYAIEPRIDVNGRSMLVRARLPNPDGKLRPGLFSRVSLIVDSVADAVLVPEEAIVPDGDQHYVYRVVDNRATWTEVEIGERKDALVEIRRGLGADDIVVTAGQMKLRDGVAINFADPDRLRKAVPLVAPVGQAQ